VNKQSLLERIELGREDFAAFSGLMAPLAAHDVFLSLSTEAACFAAQYGADLFVAVDQHTAAQTYVLDEVRHHAKGVFVLGDVPPAWAKADNVFTRSLGERMDEHDRLLLLLSSGISLAILGTVRTAKDNLDTFDGGWTAQRPFVAAVAETLLGEDARGLLSQNAPHQEAGLEQGTALAMRLAALHTDALVSQQRDIVMDKDDLFSVLDILKAISAKRRAHDILFVFVEQIVKVVRSDRCSVVRVWGGERHGHVLASHEDADIIDYDIDLEKYPELVRALKTREKVAINDVASDRLTAPCAEDLQKAHIKALLVIPIVLFDANIGSLFLRAARREGSFSLREISFFEIVAGAASNALERAHLFESIQIANERLERLAITDGLTGLYNHRYFRDRFEQEFERALRYRLPLSCMIFDLDDFKAHNDRYGHLVGDGILKEVAERTQRCVRRSDIIARYGGEEFVVIMPQTGMEGAKVEGERLCEVINSRAFRDLPKGEQVTVSVGVGVLNHDDMLDCEDLLRAADKALYEAKRLGKNQVTAKT